MDHFKKIYAFNAKEYHEMIKVEDIDANLPAKLNEIVSFNHKRVLDLGTGTGRIPLLFADEAQLLIAVDLNFPMLVEHARIREPLAGDWPMLNADNRYLPLTDDCMDIVTAGWTMGHLRGWYPEDWQKQIAMILKEMERISKAGGALIIMETMTTGGYSPAPPNEQLAEYYRWLEDEWGYTRETIQTDYQFKSVDDAVEKTTFFFGEELAEMIRENKWARLPEWTGIWYKQA